jgi:thiamine-phosphate pyrophosphorylase
MIRYFVADVEAAGGEERLLEAVARADREGADFVQLRAKAMPGRGVVRLVEAAMRICCQARVLVNTRVDVALACGAAGAHLPGGAPPPGFWRSVAPPDFVFTVACHSLEEAKQAEQEGANLVLFSPVFDPLSKAVSGPAAGLNGLAGVCRAVRIPVLALGGITPERIPECMEAGAAGVAGISLFLRSG